MFSGVWEIYNSRSSNLKSSGKKKSEKFTTFQIDSIENLELRCQKNYCHLRNIKSGNIKTDLGSSKLNVDSIFEDSVAKLCKKVDEFLHLLAPNLGKFKYSNSDLR